MFKWESHYSVGIEKIDQQHKELFEIGRKLDELVKTRSHSDNFSDIILAVTELLSYTTEHFNSEEEYMQSIKYPGLEEHRIQHRKMIDYITQIDIANIHMTQHKTLESLVEFLGQWITNHILDVDQKYSEYQKKD